MEANTGTPNERQTCLTQTHAPGIFVERKGTELFDNKETNNDVITQDKMNYAQFIALAQSGTYFNTTGNANR